jgi:hypothetical protein
MRAIVTVIALVVALAFVADIYWYDGSYSRMVIYAPRVGFYFLVNNW